jgi:pimeloyl-ACP methyl ester carboxylesterase
MSSARRRWAIIAAITAGVLVIVAIAGVLVVRSLVSGTGEVPTALGPVGATETVPCPTFVTDGAALKAAKDEAEGKTYSCGVVVVPENHDKPDGRTIELFYLKLDSHTQPAAAEPLVYLAGGPGGSGAYDVSANPTLNQNLERIRQTRDIIAYDQRGTGFSQYLLCAPFEAMLGILQDRDKNPQIAETIAKLKSTDSGIGYGALRSNLCGVGTTLLAGVDLTQYNSVSSSKDIPQVVKALGYTKGYSIYGTSYGTRLAQEAMRTVPDGIRGVILDGSSGPSIPNNMWSSTKPAAPYVEVLALCAADRACNTAYPNIEQRFGALLTKLEKKPLAVKPAIDVWTPLTVVFPKKITQIDPAFFIDVAKLDNLAMGGGFASLIPRMIKAAEQGDVAWFRSTKLVAPAGEAATPPTADPPVTTPTPVLPTDQPLFQKPLSTLLEDATLATEHTAGQSTDVLWVTVALADLAVRLKKGENQANLTEALLRLSVLPNAGSSAQQLLDYSKANLSPESAKIADSLVGKMTRNDVRMTMWNIQDVAMTLGDEDDARADSLGMQFAVNCADELAFSSLDQAKAELARTPYPQLAAFPLAVNEQILASCVAYPTPLDASVTEPVSSGIPTLIYANALDNETPVEWSRTIAKGLSRSTLVNWRNMGHIASAHDPKFCAGDVAAAFLTDPTATPDLTCTQAADYQLAFELK